MTTAGALHHTLVSRRSPHQHRQAAPPVRHGTTASPSTGLHGPSTGAGLGSVPCRLRRLQEWTRAGWARRRSLPGPGW